MLMPGYVSSSGHLNRSEGAVRVQYWYNVSEWWRWVVTGCASSLNAPGEPDRLLLRIWVSKSWNGYIINIVCVFCRSDWISVSTRDRLISIIACHRTWSISANASYIISNSRPANASDQTKIFSRPLALDQIYICQRISLIWLAPIYDCLISNLWLKVRLISSPTSLRKDPKEPQTPLALPAWVPRLPKVRLSNVEKFTNPRFPCISTKFFQCKTWLP